MLKPQDNERVTRVGPGTPMGSVMRQYWLPALLSEELPENDGAPLPIRLLGEDLIAFRDSEGNVGLVDAFCPHRRAPMFFGRNEECGLRCVYHGWKFDRNGACVDMPSEPSDSLFKTKVAIKAYPTYEAGSVVWAYLGSSAEPQPLPDFEWMRPPATHRFISKTYESCNWLQGLEGGLDTAHTSFLHNERLGDLQVLRSRDPHPRLEISREDYGFSYASIRDVGEEGFYVRVNHFVMPFHQMRGGVTSYDGGRTKVPKLDGHIWVPIDDHTTYVYNMLWTYDENVDLTPEYVAYWESLSGRGREHLLPGYRLKANGANDYNIDRQRQKTKTFTGIVGLNTQDWAVQEGMGPVTDRSREHLGTTDTAVITVRQLLLEACAVVAAGGTPRGLEPSTYRSVRPYDDYVPHGTSWQEAWAPELTAKW